MEKNSGIVEDAKVFFTVVENVNGTTGARVTGRVAKNTKKKL